MPAELMPFLKLRLILSGWGNSQLQAALTLVAPPQKCSPHPSPSHPDKSSSSPGSTRAHLHAQWALMKVLHQSTIFLSHPALPTPRHTRASE